MVIIINYTKCYYGNTLSAYKYYRTVIVFEVKVRNEIILHIVLMTINSNKSKINYKMYIHIQIKMSGSTRVNLFLSICLFSTLFKHLNETN